MEGKDTEVDSDFICHEECPSCGSSDALARYSDGHGYCFSCRHYEADDAPPNKKRITRMAGLIDGDVLPLLKRGINEETCRKFGYIVGEHKGRKCQAAPYRTPDGSSVVAQKLRFADKTFSVVGDMKTAGLFGQHLWRDSGKKIVVTEGEIDCLSVSQLQQNKWPVVSIPTGAQGAKKALSKAMEWLLGFDEIILMFDDDEPGREAVTECAALFPPGRCKAAWIDGYKDANAALVDQKGSRVIDAIFGAKVYRPEGIVTLADLEDSMMAPVEWGLPWIFPKLTQATFGRRMGEAVGLGAGTGVGKTDLLTQQIVYDLTELSERVGVFFLEQPPKESAKRITGKYSGKRFWVPDDGWTVDELKAGWGVMKGLPLFLYDHFGCTEWEPIEKRIRFLFHSEGVRIFYLDHLTALADPANEKESIEQIMSSIGGLVQELGIWLCFVSHLATPEGKPHEEGGRVTIRHFKGARAIGFWCSFMFGMERDQQSEDEDARHVTTFRVLKDRYTGQSTGLTVRLGYDSSTGRLFEMSDDETGNTFKDETGDDDDDIPF